jgi:hypothetical protein
VCIYLSECSGEGRCPIISLLQDIKCQAEVEGGEAPNCHYQLEEGCVVGTSNAVVEPHAVVVEVQAAAVALAAVLRPFIHEAFAERTPEDVLVVLI